ncbi:DUF2844 domain-containing protein [Paraburkholderia sp. NMBU_R16]|uniref:DUF2844 domain-containing protein n=1 Tax=Paraburkholderia sp. NMBU_R16 TaxID=2698676 RepID=UPI00349F8407
MPAAAALCGALGFGTPASAELGGAPMTTPSGAVAKTLSPVERAASSTRSSIASPSYRVQETTFPVGTVVREYIDADGKVFGIAWRGPFAPNLSALLGTYFSQYKSAVEAQRARRPGRGPVAVEQSGLVVHSLGHMGAYSGQAYLSTELPSGVSADDIQ